jgi:hypothetical protein
LTNPIASGIATSIVLPIKSAKSSASWPFVAAAERTSTNEARRTKGLGGCGEKVGANDCKGQGGCSVPLMEGVWGDLRKKKEAEWTEKKLESGAAPAKAA